MSNLQNGNFSVRNISGTALLVFGAALAYFRIESGAERFAGLLSAYGSDAIGTLPATGLAIARLFQDVALDPAPGFSFFVRFLVSFWPIAAIFLGALLLRKSLFPQFVHRASTGEHSATVAQGVRP
jgi:hypothetical protein